MPRYKLVNNELIQLTTDEETKRNQEEKNWNDQNVPRKLAEVRAVRNIKLNETDWKVISAKEQGTNLSTSFKNWRQSLRDIPTTYTTESEYDELLARDDDGNLTHSVWSES